MKLRIDTFDQILMLMVAAFFDLIQILLLLFFGIGLILNRLVTIIEYFIFTIWFSFQGVNVFGSGFLNKTSSTFIGEIIPGLGSLPLFTLGIWMIIKQSQKEDREKNNQKEN